MAGNLSQQQVNFKLDLTATDSQPPIIRPQFPLPDQEISTVSMMAIKFQVLDADSEVNFEEMVVEINGVITMTYLQPEIATDTIAIQER